MDDIRESFCHVARCPLRASYTLIDKSLPGCVRACSLTHVAELLESAREGK